MISGDFDRSALRAKLGIANDKTVVLTVGQFVDRKGRWPYLEAIAHLSKKRSDIACIWLTPQFPSESDLERVHTYETNDTFRLILSSQIGSSREEVIKFFRIGDLFVLPSYIEGVPIALLEAMSLGLPCISTNVNGIPEAIHPEITGLLVEAGDSGALCNAIERIADDHLLAERLGRQGQQFVLTNFDDRESARVALQEYEACFPRLRTEI
jgi:glycosyltransferase involved in cell wall biosynthesis